MRRRVIDDTVWALDRLREAEGRAGTTHRSVHTTFDIQVHRFRWPLGKIRRAVETEIARRGEPDQRIGRRGEPYLERWHVERTMDRHVNLHRFVGPDPDVGPHDHPWNSVSLILAGRQDEYWLPAYAYGAGPLRTRRLEAGDIVYRSAEFSHQLRTARGSEATPLSLFVTGPRVREWGFWVERDGDLHHERHPPDLAEPERPRS